MLIKTLPISRAFLDRAAVPSRQAGVVLMVSLMILVALTIAGIALVRSVDTTNLIAGNLAFQQSTTRSAEAGIEDAIRSVVEGLPLASLNNNDLTRAYVAATPASENPATPADWDQFWHSTVDPLPRLNPPVSAKTCQDRFCALPTDAAGNTVFYTIQRLCRTAGDPKLSTTGCTSGTRKVAGEGQDLEGGRSNSCS